MALFGKKEPSVLDAYNQSLLQQQQNINNGLATQRVVGIGEGMAIPEYLAKEYNPKKGRDANYIWEMHDAIQAGEVPGIDAQGKRTTVPGAEPNVDQLKGPNPYIEGAIGLGGLAISAYDSIGNRKVQNKQIKLMDQQIAANKLNMKHAATEQAAREAARQSWTDAWNNASQRTIV